MNLQEIKQAVNDGKIVCWLNDRYMVKIGGKYGYIIIHKPTNLEMEFLQFDGNKLIANESDFFILEKPMKKHSENKAKKGYIEVRDKNDLLSELFGYASLKQARANHKKFTL